MADINHKLDMKENKEDTEKSIQRPKKPRSQAQIDATKKMLEGRKKWAEKKQKEKEETKQLKKEAKKKIKEKVIEEQSILDGLSKEELEDLSKKATGQIPLEEQIEEVKLETTPPPSPVKQTRAQQRKPRNLRKE